MLKFQRSIDPKGASWCHGDSLKYGGDNSLHAANGGIGRSMWWLEASTLGRVGSSVNFVFPKSGILTRNRSASPNHPPA